MKIHEVIFSRDLSIMPIADRWYRINGAFTVDIKTDCGVKHICVDDGFMTDGRSGSSWIDALGIAPNLGNQEEMKAYILHDLLYYDIGFTFEEANELLYSMLRQCGYGWFRARLIYNAVSLFGKDHFGLPIVGDREYENITKLHIRHFDK